MIRDGRWRVGGTQSFLYGGVPVRMMTSMPTHLRMATSFTWGLLPLLVGTPALAQDWDQVLTRGNGVLMQTHVPVPPFTAIRVQAPIDIELGEGPTEGAEVHVDSNLASRVRLDVDHGVLTVTMVGMSHSLHQRSRIRLRTPTLEAISLEGSADMTVLRRRQKAEGLKLTLAGSGDLDWEGGDGETLDVVISGSGDLDLKGRFRTANIHVSGSGDLDAKQLQVREGLQVNLGGSGDVTLEGSAQALKAELSGSGNLTVKGMCGDALRAVVSGSGELDAGEFRCRSAFVTTQGSGDARVLVVAGGRLVLEAHGSGAIAWSDGSQQGTVGGQHRTFHRGP